jgi:hypothetical protein
MEKEILWVSECKEKVEQIYKDGIPYEWNHEDVEAPSECSKRYALIFLQKLLSVHETHSLSADDRSMCPEKIKPSIDGGITMLWKHSNNRQIDMAFFNDGDNLLCYSDRNTRPIITSVDEHRLTDAAERIYNWLHA